MTRFTDTIPAVTRAVVGRRRELERILAVLEAGRDVILEGPPGTSKTTLLREISVAAGAPLEIVEGAPGLLPAKLVGGHDPAAVLGRGYREDAFVEGPLLRAMRSGGILYVEEFNRIPEDVTNVLIRAMSERRIVVPRMGEVHAAASFRVIASMNPYDDTGTERISRAIGDRFCKVRMTYQSEEEEREIVRRRASDVAEVLVRLGVAIARASRRHPEVQMGASVRGAIDFAAVTARLLELRGAAADAPPPELLFEGAVTALSSKIWMSPTSESTVEGVLREILVGLLGLPAEALGPPEEPPGEGGGEEAAGTGRRAGHDASRARPSGRGEARPATAAPGARPGALAAAPSAGESPLDAHRRFLALAGLGAGPLLGAEPLAEVDRALRRARAVRLPAIWLSPRRGARRSLRLSCGSEGGDVEVDATLERWSAGQHGLVALARRRAPRAFALILDVSGSMAGAAWLAAAVTTELLSRHLNRVEHAVVAFSHRALTLKRLRRCAWLPRIARLRARGTTNVSSGLSEGWKALASSRSPERVGVLITDGAHNHPSDPLWLAARFPTLHVLAWRPPWDRALRLCRELAARGRGRCRVVRSLDEMPRALVCCLEDGEGSRP